MSRSRLWRLAALVALLAALLVWKWRQRPATTAPAPSNASSDPVLTETETRAFLALEAKERELEQTVWKEELVAQQHEDVFLALWDTLNHSSEPLTALAEFNFE